MTQSAKVLAVTGTAYVQAADGSLRALKAGDTVERGEAVRTAAGARVDLLTADAGRQSLEGAGNPLPDAAATAPETAGTAAAGAQAGQAFSPGAVIQALQQGVDLSQALAPAAAGAGSAGGGEGNRFVRLLRVTESVDALSYDYQPEARAEVLSPDPTGGPMYSQYMVLVASPPPAAPPPVEPPPALPPVVPPPVEPPPPAPPPPDLRSARLELDEAAVAGGNSAAATPSGASASAQVWSGTSSGTLTSVRIGEAGEFTPLPVPAGGLVSIGFDRDGQPLAPGSAQPAAARLDVDSTGGYTFTVIAGLDHEPGLGSNQLTLPHVVHLLGTDSQGASTMVDLSLLLRDDVPVLLSSGQTEVVRLDEHDLLARPGEALVVNGDVRGQASWGADGFGRITELDWAGGSAAIPSGAASITLYFDSLGQVQPGPEGAAASVLVRDDGRYTFTLDRSLLVSGADRNIVSLLGEGLSLAALDGDGDLLPGIRIQVEIADDIPAVSAVPVVAGGAALTTHDALTAGAASDSATADFALAFGTAVRAEHGADGPGTVELGGWALQLARSESGLSSGGQAVSLGQDGGDIVGRTAAREVFRLGVDGGGRVTLTQYEALDHGVPGGTAHASVGLGAGVLSLNAMATVSDADGDLATTALGTDLGRLIRFDDALPRAQLRSPTGSDDTGNSSDRVVDLPPRYMALDESLPDEPGTAAEEGNGQAGMSEDFSVYFHSDMGRGHDAATADAVDYGVEGKGDIRFSLGLTSTDAAGVVSAVDGVPSGIYALAAGGIGQGPEILLYRVNDTLVEGRVGSQAFFSVSVDAATGAVEFARQGVSVWNPVAGDGNDPAVLLGADAAQTAGGHSLVLTQTVSDSDGSTSSVSAHLAGYGSGDLLPSDLFSIADDAPVASSLHFMLGGPGSVELPIGAQTGSDGGLIESVSIDGVSYDYLGASSGGAGTWDAGSKVWTIETSGGATLTVDMDGDPGVAQDHGWLRYSTPVDTGLAETIVYTLVDGDGDTSSSTLTVSVGTAALSGGGGGETLIGNDGAGSLHGGSGSDLLTGGAGDDLLDGGGNPRLSFSNSYGGGDTASYADAAASSGTHGVTVSLAVSDPQDTRSAGTDTLAGIEHLIGSAYDDVLIGDGGRNRLAGGAGNDSLSGGAGSDTLSGGAGADVMLGEGSGDSLLGGDGDDLLDGGTGDDTLAGGAGVDTLQGGDGNDSLFGGAGDDLLDGGAGDDTLQGHAGADVLQGSEGDDVLVGGAGDDVLDGGANGAGGDTASYLDAAPGPGRSGVTVSLALSGPQDTGSTGRDALAGIENLLGSDYDDVLVGNDEANRLTGGSGNDTLAGGAGDDWLAGKAGADALQGGAGNDTLVGGAGADVFVWRLADRDSSTDHVIDFNLGEGDALDLRELLDGEHGSAAGFNLDQYLRFDTSGAELALLIDQDGGPAFVAQQALVLDNFADRQALAAVLGSADDDMAIIRQMIGTGSLKADA